MHGAHKHAWRTQARLAHVSRLGQFTCGSIITLETAGKHQVLPQPRATYHSPITKKKKEIYILGIVFRLSFSPQMWDEILCRKYYNLTGNTDKTPLQKEHLIKLVHLSNFIIIFYSVRTLEHTLYE